MTLPAGDDPLVRLVMLSANKQDSLSDGKADAMSVIEQSICDLVAGHVEAEHVPRGYIRCSGSMRIQQCSQMCLSCNPSVACARPCNMSGAVFAGSQMLLVARTTTDVQTQS